MGVAREGVRVGKWIVGGIVALAVLGVTATFVFGGAGWITAPFRGAAEERENTVGSGAFRQSTYQEFFDLCEAAQNAEGTIEALRQERGSASAARKAQIDQSVMALTASRTESVNEYNSKAAQEHRAPFRDRDLPYRLDADDAGTVCAK
ncbi:hypothetical protein [Streptomyces sp. NP-1717]|uniref:hypothetical protein n=1 Tax=Streptomyces sp. NP-1717 TaxID=2704470 RepID=UPI001F5C57CC|nr:hypothetical protein [Streptomyces sp. NP-1717]MCI3223053.1 hypothetical protein [Streptomyces sp. NP-1717]